MENVVSKELDYTPLLVAEPEFIFTLPAVANKQAMMFSDFCPFFRQIQVYTRGGLDLMNHTNFHLHAKMVTMRNKPLVETENTFASYRMTDDQYMIPCLSSKLPSSYAAGMVYNPNYTGQEAAVPYIEPRYLLAAAQGETNIVVTIPFNELYESILCVDKDIMLNETLLVRFVWSELANIAFAADPAAALPENSPAIQPPPSPDPTTNPVALPAPAAFNVTNMAIYLAVEKNLAIVNELQTKIFSPEGFSLMIPYSYSYQAALTGQNQSVTLRVNRQNDSSLLTPRIHNRNWCWIEEFGDGTSNFNKDNAITGIDLNLGEQKWDFVGFLSGAANLTHQSTVVCKRKLVITPNGLVLV
ncbi:hypothetical protein SAMD00019534_056170 [Acytostelium subglobosum LB1]|uniref:hypothetical protein n=1 Tax=Acytostelium subglobosum LB1 TaxID=1410327 RepID=UPI0006447CD9|nr:hypothetical protein SAMD00019534_056170 [Acytostelium subglobosum LB1]GAM22442.1 hypothetical protein SAMD00019534_056170 [Acytostelium subglobosum LB1]|eukprot:XP_012754562.1 hypothetical protein SAMD00019534_056170 [Acytostelium subglobosum LB1]